MSKKYRKLRHDIAYVLLLTLVFISKKIPRFLGLMLFGFLGFVFGFILKKERNIARKNLKRVFADYDDKRINKITNGVFINAGKSFFDSVKIPEYSKEKFLKIARFYDEKSAKETLANPNGVVVLAAHLSAFELQTQLVAVVLPKIMTIGSRLFDGRVDDIFVKLRKRNGVEYYDRDGGIMNVLRNLKKGFIFGVLVDQDATNEGVFANFLGEEAYTPFIPVKIAIRNDIPLTWGFLIREKGDKYALHIEKAQIIKTENEMETYILNLEKFNEKLGEFIKKYPEQWVWMHNRWKRKPKDFSPELSISYYKKGEEK
ncbi:MAG: hypothetical protein FWF51_07495 [Chitinivibrionia bacterium]|nr:hypothetical protein [Chitinivibrionia bacterium]